MVALATWASGGAEADNAANEEEQALQLRDPSKSRFFSQKIGLVPEPIKQMFESSSRADKTAIINCAVKRDDRGRFFLSFGDNMFKEVTARFTSKTGTDLDHGVTRTIANAKCGGAALAFPFLLLAGGRISLLRRSSRAGECRAQRRSVRSQPEWRRVLRLQGMPDACLCGCALTRAGDQGQEDHRQAQLVGDDGVRRGLGGPRGAAHESALRALPETQRSLLFESLAENIVESLVESLVGSLVDSLLESLAEKLVESLAGSLADSLVDSLLESLVESLLRGLLGV